MFEALCRYCHELSKTLVVNKSTVDDIIAVLDLLANSNNSINSYNTRNKAEHKLQKIRRVKKYFWRSDLNAWKLTETFLSLNTAVHKTECWWREKKFVLHNLTGKFRKACKANLIKVEAVGLHHCASASMKILLLPAFHSIHILGRSEAQRRFTHENLSLQTKPFLHIKSENKKTMIFFVLVIANYKNLSFLKDYISKSLRWNFTVLVLIEAEFFAEWQNYNQIMPHCLV